jgi:hypothetical protein
LYSVLKNQLFKAKWRTKVRNLKDSTTLALTISLISVEAATIYPVTTDSFDSPPVKVFDPRKGFDMDYKAKNAADFQGFSATDFFSWNHQ